jgi:hypothetical protein
LTAREVAAPAIEKLLQDREELEHHRIDVAIPGQATGQGLHAQHQVLAHRELGNDLPPLGHIADATPGPLVRRHGGQLPILQLHRSRALPQQPDDGLEQGGLAHAIAPDQTHHLARAHAHVDVAQDVALAVIDVQPTHFKQVASHAASWVSLPRYTSITRGSFCT